MEIMDFITNQYKLSIETKISGLSDEQFLDNIRQACELTLGAYQRNNKTLIAGNGGSAADAQHIAGEFVSRFYFDRPGLASIAITTDTSILTAIGNDYGYEKIFSRQIEALGSPGDVLIALSTSGKSKNIIAAIDSARKRDIKVIGLTGESGGLMKEKCDVCLCVHSEETPRIQESHILLGHIICAYVEDRLFHDHRPKSE
jgi:D-sedoheptulose 7-phosphate isomerase